MSRRSAAGAFEAISPHTGIWSKCKWIILISNYVFMALYCTVCGWMLYYALYSLSGRFAHIDSINFFLHGPGNRQPMKLSDIADETGLHVSTVSRALRSKYLQCAYGIFPLNYFLTSTASVDTSSGQAQTPEYIKDHIRKIIGAENKKKPLSDEAIAKQLLAVRISISRRTVNKYRQEMGIPDKTGRRECP